MNTTHNELIAVIDTCRAGGSDVKSIRKQKFAPSDFYMTRIDGKQIGPVKCAGNADELNRKFDEAVAHLHSTKNAPKRAA